MGSARRRPKYFTTLYMNHLERSREIVPLASIQAMPGSVPSTTQELKRYGELRQETQMMADYNPTQQMRAKPYNRDRSSRTQRKGRKRTDKVDPSEYKIPIVKSKSMLISSILFIHPFKLSTISSTFCRRCNGRSSKYPNARQSHAAYMDDCTCSISNWFGCIDVDGIRGDTGENKKLKCTKTYGKSLDCKEIIDNILL